MKKNNIFWGIVWILAAAFLIVSKLGYMQDVGVFTIIFTIALAAIIIKSIVRVNFAGIFFPLAFIAILYDRQLGIENLTPWTVLIAAALISIGLSMVFGSKIHKHKAAKNYKYELIDSEDNSHIKQDVHFSACTKYINSDDFKQADLSCSFGAMEIYFDNAVIQGDSAVVNINASFSGIELYVPKNWKIVNKMSITLGGLDDNNASGYEKDKSLILVGSMSLGGIDVNYI